MWFAGVGVCVCVWASCLACSSVRLFYCLASSLSDMTNVISNLCKLFCMSYASFCVLASLLHWFLLIFPLPFFTFSSCFRSLSRPRPYASTWCALAATCQPSAPNWQTPSMRSFLNNLFLLFIELNCLSSFVLAFIFFVKTKTQQNGRLHRLPLVCLSSQFVGKIGAKIHSNGDWPYLETFQLSETSQFKPTKRTSKV